MEEVRLLDKMLGATRGTSAHFLTTKINRETYGNQSAGTLRQSCQVLYLPILEVVLLLHDLDYVEHLHMEMAVDTSVVVEVVEVVEKEGQLGRMACGPSTA